MPGSTYDDKWDESFALAKAKGADDARAKRFADQRATKLRPPGTVQNMAAVRREDSPENIEDATKYGKWAAGPGQRTVQESAYQLLASKAAPAAPKAPAAGEPTYAADETSKRLTDLKAANVAGFDVVPAPTVRSTNRALGEKVGAATGAAMTRAAAGPPGTDSPPTR